MKNSSLTYRPDIDGLRAIAVLMVVMFHAFPGVCPGGFVGVDIFFVISGFLISSTILKDLAEGRFSLKGFYARRFRRIIPALAVMLASIWIAGYFLLPGDDFIRLGKHLIGGATFTSNILLKTEAGYFDSSADLKPFLHLWSLGIEEQFYLIWPLLLLVLFRNRVSLRKSVSVLFILSFAVNVGLIARHASSAFYLLPARFWELLLGCGLAIIQSRDENEFSRLAFKYRNGTGALAVLLLVVSEIYLNKGSRFPGWLALLPTVSAFLLILSGPEAWINRTVLSNRLAVFIGLISYPLYLWHWPLISFARILSSDQKLSSFLLVILVLTSMFLAFLTWKFVESPVQKALSFDSDRGSIPPGLAVGMALSVCGVLTLVGWSTYHENLISLDRARNPWAYALERTAHFDLTNVRLGKCFLDTTQTAQEFDSSCTQIPSGKNSSLMLLGDSHAAHLYPGLSKLLESSEIALIQLNGSSCPPLFFLNDRFPDGCRKVSSFILNQVKAIRPSTVILDANWEIYNGDKSFTPFLKGSIRELRSSGVKNIIIIGQSPSWAIPLPKMIENKFLRQGLPVPRHTWVGLSSYSTDMGANEILRKFANHSDLPFISLLDDLCNSEGCLTTVGERATSFPIDYDTDHLTLMGSRFVAFSIIGPKLVDLGLLHSIP